MNFIPITVAQDEDIRDVYIDADRSYRLEPDGYLLATYYSLEGELMVCPPRGYKLMSFNGSEIFGDIRFDEEPKIWDIPEAQFEDDYPVEVLIEHNGQKMTAVWSPFYEFTLHDDILTGVLRDRSTLQRLPFNSAKLLQIDGIDDYKPVLADALSDDKHAGKKRDMGYDIRSDGERFLVPVKLSGYDDVVFVDVAAWCETTRASSEMFIHGSYYDAEDRPIRPLGIVEVFAGYTTWLDMMRRYHDLRDISYEEPKTWVTPEAQFEDDYVVDIVIEHDGQVMNAVWSTSYEFDTTDGTITGVLRDYDTFRRLPFNTAKLLSIDGITDYADILAEALVDDAFAGKKRDMGYDIRSDGERFLVPIKLSGYDDVVFIDLAQWNDTTSATNDLIIHGSYFDADDRPIEPLGVTEMFAGCTDRIEMIFRYQNLRNGAMRVD